MRVAKLILSGFSDFPDASRYDLLLAVLPLPLAFGTAAAALLGVPTALGVGLGGIPSALLLAYGLFLDAPIPEDLGETDGRDRPAAIDGRDRRRRGGRGRAGA